MLKVIPSNHFRKDLKLAKKRGLKIEKLAEMISTPASGETLAEKYRDHGLTGNYEGFRAIQNPTGFWSTGLKAAELSSFCSEPALMQISSDAESWPSFHLQRPEKHPKNYRAVL